MEIRCPDKDPSDMIPTSGTRLESSDFKSHLRSKTINVRAALR